MNSLGAILIVDDDAESRTSLDRMLTAQGYATTLAADGETALSSSLVAPPDLILSDICMHGIDGYELCRRLKAHEATRHIPIILVSAVAEPREWAEGLRLGAVDFVSKPFQAEELLARIAMHLELCRAHAEIKRDAAALSRAILELRGEIAERRLAVEALLQSEQRYERIAKGIMDYVYSVRVENGEAVETRHGSACVAVTGYTAKDFGVDPLLWINMIPLEERGVVRDHVQEILSGQATPPIEHRIIRKDGEMRWVSDTAIPHKNASGDIISYDGVIKDITDRKRSEEVILRQREELAHVARIATMSELAASLAHELSQPLAAILSNAQAALRLLKAGTPDLDEVHDALADIVNDDRRAGSIIKELRSFVKKGDTHRESLDMAEVIGGLLLLTQGDAVVRNVAVIKDLAAGLPRVHGSRIQLQQVILNLFINGCESMDDVDSAERVLGIRAFAEKPGTVVVEVSDRGHGLAGDMEKRIFDPLFTTKPTGLGMGLSIARTTIEAHGGTLTARNNHDRGATFRFELPSEGGNA